MFLHTQRVLEHEMAHGDDNLDQDVSLAFTQEIARAAVASLHPLQEDLAEWLTRLLGTVMVKNHSLKRNTEC